MGRCDGKLGCHSCFNVLRLAKAAAIQFLLEPVDEENIKRMRLMCHSIKDLCDQIHPEEFLNQKGG